MKEKRRQLDARESSFKSRDKVMMAERIYRRVPRTCYIVKKTRLVHEAQRMAYRTNPHKSIVDLIDNTATPCQGRRVQP